jgi:hypothetical protein
MDEYFDIWFSFLYKKMLIEPQKVWGEKVIGSYMKQAFSILQNFATKHCDLDILYVEVEKGDACLGTFCREDGLIELSKNSPINMQILTLAHEIGHFLTMSNHREMSYNEVLAEMFAYLVTMFFYFGASGFSYLQRFRDKGEYLMRKKSLLREAFFEFVNWSLVNYKQ